MKQIVGNDTSISIINSSVKSNSVPHAYLFEGPPHVGKLTAAKKLAMTLNCSSVIDACSNCSQCERIMDGTHADVEVIVLNDVCVPDGLVAVVGRIEDDIDVLGNSIFPISVLK